MGGKRREKREFENQGEKREKSKRIREESGSGESVCVRGEGGGLEGERTIKIDKRKERREGHA